MKTRRTKSASFPGSKVDGTMRYSPGGSFSRMLTSRRLMKLSERAQDEQLQEEVLLKVNALGTTKLRKRRN